MGNIRKTIIKSLRTPNFNSQYELRLEGVKKLLANFEKIGNLISLLYIFIKRFRRDFIVMS